MSNFDRDFVEKISKPESVLSSFQPSPRPGDDWAGNLVGTVLLSPNGATSTSTLPQGHVMHTCIYKLLYYTSDDYHIQEVIDLFDCGQLYKVLDL